ncbi:hypothetical protein QYM36_011901 [Artemia franciscana]|uniref:Probable RNA polymerase II nuclear localization protein SLC7A6OS n=2 Tax=Artemia franciscana TaxID=6661 RepID=A0AA88HJJ2_ARTSF|nr:hypothetical protein QYM36_011901 [Artemia franciscana]
MSEIQELALMDCCEKNKKLLEKASQHMSCKRKVENQTENSSAKKYKIFEGENFQKYNIVDFLEETASSGLTLNGAEMVRETLKQEDFVYDLYFSNIPLNCVDGLLSVHPYDDVIVDDTEELVIEDDSDDSNQENYYTNEYPSTPDDSDDELYGDDKLVKNFSRFVVDSAENSDAEYQDWEKYVQNLDVTESKQDSDYEDYY